MNYDADARILTYAPDRITVLWGALIVLLETLVVLLFLRFAPVTPTGVSTYVIPFVWINLTLWAVVTVDPPSAPADRQRIASLVGGGYFLVLAYFGGLLNVDLGYLVGTSAGHAQEASFSVSTVGVPPGWGPAIAYLGPALHFAFIPFMVVGYVALAYLVYVTVLDLSTSALSGVLGLLTCVSCTWPIFASLLSGLVGSVGGVGAMVYGHSYTLSTLAFVATVALLAWRPTVR